jgi:hypothetical protein
MFLVPVARMIGGYSFLYLSRYPALEALQRFSTSLLRFAIARGKPGLYHETITWAFFLLIRERMARMGGQHPGLNSQLATETC